MIKLIIMRGLPASGKSTRAREIIANQEENTIIRVNRDLIREMLHFGKYSKSNENEVIYTEKLVVSNFLQMGQNVIIDDTNISKDHVDMWSQIAKAANPVNLIEIEIITLDTPIEECIERDKKRGNQCVGSMAIKNMNDKFKNNHE